MIDVESELFPTDPTELRIFLNEKSQGDPVKRAELAALVGILSPTQRNPSALTPDELETYRSMAQRLARAEAQRVENSIQEGFVHWLDEHYLALANAHRGKPDWEKKLAQGAQSLRSGISVEQGKNDERQKRYPSRAEFLQKWYEDRNALIMTQILQNADDQLAAVVLHRLGILSPEESLEEMKKSMTESAGQRSLQCKDKGRLTELGPELDMQIYCRNTGVWDLYILAGGDIARKMVSTPVPQSPFSPVK